MAKNGVFVAFKFAIYMLSGFFFIPFLVEHYGRGIYGLIALAGFLTQYVGLISRCVGNSTARFLNIALNKNDWKQANEIFSTALVANIGFIFIQLPFFALGIWKLEWIIDFPPEIATDFRVLVICNVAVFFTSLLTGVFITPIQAANRLDISSTLESVRLCLRITLLFVLIKTVGARLWLIGVVDISLALVHGAVVFFMYRKLAHDLVFKAAHITRKWIRPVLGMAGWTIVTALGGGFFVKTDVWMINRFVNREMAGIYAALLVWPNFLKQVGKQLASILTPVYMIDYARGNVERIVRMSLFSAKLLGCIMALISGGLYIFAEPLLGLWLGSWAADHVALFRLMVVYVVFTIGEAVLWQIYVTMNKVHYTGIVSLSAGVVNVVVSMTLIWLGFGTMGVAWGTVVASVLACSLAIPFGVCHLLGISGKVVGINHLSSLLMLMVSLFSAVVAAYVGRSSLIGALLVMGMLCLAGGGLVAKVVFTKEEKDHISRLWNGLLRWAGLFGIRLSNDVCNHDE